MNRLQLLWTSSVGKKVVMAVTGLIWVAYLVTHMLANLLVFQGPEKINAYSAFLHGTGGRTMGCAPGADRRAGAPRRRRDAAGCPAAGGPPGRVRRRSDPQVSTIAARTIRWGGALILLFLAVSTSCTSPWARRIRALSRAIPTTTWRRVSGTCSSSMLYLVAMAAWACTSTTGSGAAGAAWA